MPTGYTQCLYDGENITFADFVMEFARGRDEPRGTPIPDVYVPSDHHARKIQTYMKEREKVTSWTEEQAEREAQRFYNRRLKSYIETLIKRNERHVRYEAMLDKVKDWRPPTPDHVKLKDYMIEQLNGSIKHDCTGYPIQPPVKMSGPDYVASRLSAIDQNLSYHEREDEAEAERALQRTNWIRQLLESLATA